MIVTGFSSFHEENDNDVTAESAAECKAMVNDVRAESLSVWDENGKCDVETIGRNFLTSPESLLGETLVAVGGVV